MSRSKYAAMRMWHKRWEVAYYAAKDNKSLIEWRDKLYVSFMQALINYAGLHGAERHRTQKKVNKAKLLALRIFW